MSDSIEKSERNSLRRTLILVIGLVIPQIILYGPSLTGRTILLPLDILRAGTFYLPAEKMTVFKNDIGPSRATNAFRPHNESLSDQVLSYEIERRFVASEFRAGRIPLWSPFNYAGAPFVNWPKYSPFNLMYCLVPSPHTLAWIQLIKSLIAGCGAFLFFRRTVSLSYWPATIAAWSFPLTGQFIYWQGYPQTYVTVWLPWLLIVVDWVVRHPKSAAGPVLAIMTAIVTVSGQLDTAGHVLIASGIFAIYCLRREFRSNGCLKVVAISAGILIAGWGTGFLLAAPELLPLAEYSTSGSRLGSVEEIANDRPPSGIVSIPRIVLPRIYGSTEQGWHHLGGHTEFESASAAYTGLLLTLMLAPLAFRDIRRRRLCCCMVFMAIVGLAWELNIPGFVHILKMPGLNLRPHNRFVCVASFAILTLSALGLESLIQRALTRTIWIKAAAVMLLLTGSYCTFRSVYLPEPIATELSAAVNKGLTSRDLPDVKVVTEIQTTYRTYMSVNAVLCLAGLVLITLVIVRPDRQPFVAGLSGALLLAELVWAGFGVNPQCDKKFYYPQLPALQQLQWLPPGRVLGMGCLPPKLNEIHGLHEIRGYDGIDPPRYVELLSRCADPRVQSPDYAKTLNYVPMMRLTDDGRLELPGAINMLNLRYLILPKPVPLPFRSIPRISGSDETSGYAVIENTGSLPRVYVPKTAEYFQKSRLILSRVTDPDFNPLQVAHIEERISLPDTCIGTGQVVRESSMEVVVNADMRTKGLMVLADRWDQGWKAWSNGRELPVLRTNYVLRGVVLEAGKSTVIFQYEPQSFVWGIRLFIMAAVIVAAWTLLVFKKAQEHRRPALHPDVDDAEPA